MGFLRIYATCLARSEQQILEELKKNKDDGIQFHHFMANRRGKNGSCDRFYFLGSKITADGDCTHEIKRHLLLGRKVMTNLDNILKKQRYYFANKDLFRSSKVTHQTLNKRKIDKFKGLNKISS